MLKFILKGIFRDRHRYLFPLIIVASGIAILVFGLAFMEGFTVSFVRHNARFETGHLKVVTKAYAKQLSLKPFDLAMLDVEPELARWKQAYPQLDWVQRISFGALLDVPDSLGETREQGEVAGFAADIINNPAERDRLNLNKALVDGRLPRQKGEVLISRTAFHKLGLRLGDPITLISSTVHGAMSMHNLKVVGSVDFGVQTLDRGAVVADISDVRTMLDLEGGASEVLAFFKHGNYKASEVNKLKADFNSRFSGPEEFDVEMLALTDQGNLAYFMAIMKSSLGIMSLVFIIILGIVLWNSGLMNGIRRWGEFGLRLAVGERKIHAYGSLVGEALVLGIAGSLLGILAGGAISLLFARNGIDVSAYARSSSIVSESMIYTALNLQTLLIGLITGVMSTLVGAALAGIPIFRRQTSQLFKELES